MAGFKETYTLIDNGVFGSSIYILDSFTSYFLAVCVMGQRIEQFDAVVFSIQNKNE